MKVLLTGYKGNLGSHLRNNLAKCDIVLIGKNDQDKIESKFQKGVDIVLHAGYDFKHHISNSPVSNLEANVMSTARLLELSKRYSASKFIFISSCSVYGDNQDTSENSSPAPIISNGAIKLLNEKLIQEFCIYNSIDYQIFRVFNMYGGNDTFSVLSKIENAVKAKKVFTLFNGGESRRDFVHVDDVAKIISQLMFKKTRNAIINIGTGKTVSIKEIVDYYKENMRIENKGGVEEACDPKADISLLQNLINYKFRNVIEDIKLMKTKLKMNK